MAFRRPLEEEKIPLMKYGAYARTFATAEEQQRGQPDTNSESVGFSFRKFWWFIGPGFLMSVAYLDPGNIQADLQAGSMAKYQLLWALLWSSVMGIGVQILAVRLANVTGLHLAEVCHREYTPVARILVWLMIEISAVATDIQQVVVSALGIYLLSNSVIPVWGAILITFVDTVTLLLTELPCLKRFNIFFAVLFTTTAACLLSVYVVGQPDQVGMLTGLSVPWCNGCSANATSVLVVMIGAIVQPHNVYLLTGLVAEKDFDKNVKKYVKEANLYCSIETVITFFLSFLVNVFVVGSFAAAFSNSPGFNPLQASLATAGTWIDQKFVPGLKIAWGIALLAIGQGITFAGGSVGQFLMKGFLNVDWMKWQRTLAIRTISVIPTLVMAVAVSDVNSTLAILNTWMNVVQNIQIPFALLPLLHFTSSERVMGAFKNGIVVRIFGWLLILLVIGLNICLLYLYLFQDTLQWYLYLISGIVLTMYFMLVIYLAIDSLTVVKIQIWFYEKLGADSSVVRARLEELRNIRYTIKCAEPEQVVKSLSSMKMSTYQTATVEATITVVL